MTDDKAVQTGGVLVIPNDNEHPASFSYASPRAKRLVKDLKRGTVREIPVIYTFKRGHPARVEDTEDYKDLLKEKAYLSGGRGFVPMFRKVSLSKGPGRAASEKKLTGLLLEFLRAHNINPDDFVRPADTVDANAADAILDAVLPEEAPNAGSDEGI